MANIEHRTPNIERSVAARAQRHWALGVGRWMLDVPKFILISTIRLYQWTLSPAQAVVFGPLGRCRFDPSCSAFMLEAIQTHGALAGSWQGVKRICRCHPWGDCGHDPVPKEKCQVRSAKCEVSGRLENEIRREPVVGRVAAQEG